MTKTRYLYWLAFLIASAIISSCAKADTPPDWYQLTELSDGSASFAPYSKGESIKRTVTNVRLREGVNASDVPFYTDPANFKNMALSGGYICIIDLTKASADEIEIQNRSRKCGTPSAPNEKTSKESKPSIIASIASWLWANWEKVIGGGLLALLLTGVGWLVRRLRAAAARKAVDLIIAGVKSAGKTALYKRLIDPDITKEDIDALQSSNALGKGKTESIVAGKFTFFPRLKDIPGSFLGQIIDEFTTKKTFLGYKTTRTALIIVLAPAGMRSQTITAANSEYLNEQYGWSTLIQGIVQSQKLHRPDVIAIFLNKSDLYEGSVPWEQLEPRMREEFGRVVGPIQKAAAQAKIPLVVASGSARLGIGTGDLISKLTRKLAQGPN